MWAGKLDRSYVGGLAGSDIAVKHIADAFASRHEAKSLVREGTLLRLLRHPRMVALHPVVTPSCLPAYLAKIPATSHTSLQFINETPPI